MKLLPDEKVLLNIDSTGVLFYLCITFQYRSAMPVVITNKRVVIWPDWFGGTSFYFDPGSDILGNGKRKRYVITMYRVGTSRIFRDYIKISATGFLVPKLVIFSKLAPEIADIIQTNLPHRVLNLVSG